LASETGDDNARGITIDTMSESWMGKSPRRFPSLVDEIVLDLLDEGYFISFMVGTVDDESRGFIIDEDIIILVEYARGFELIAYSFPLIVFRFVLLPREIQRILEIYFQHISLAESGTFGKLLSPDGDFFCSKGFIDLSELCSGEYLSQVSIESLVEIISGGFYLF